MKIGVLLYKRAKRLKNPLNLVSFGKIAKSLVLKGASQPTIWVSRLYFHEVRCFLKYEFFYLELANQLSRKAERVCQGRIYILTSATCR
ncbi:MAG: hypothetical protein CMK56_00295 [Proteobacteria bacterium]|nr:hypothetical protein [Pseudomonadota bacterium]